jgi:predicted component of type VI protein secretion system
MSDERNKAQFKFDAGSQREEIKIKPRIALVDQFFPEPAGELGQRTLHPITSRDDVETLLKDHAFALRLEVPDCLNEGEGAPDGQKPATQNVELKIDSLERFTPGGIVEQIKQSTGETNAELRTGFVMLEATKQLRAQLGATNRKNAQFVESLVKKVVQARRTSTAVGDKLRQSTPADAPAKSGGFLESLTIKKAPEENG